VLQLLEEIQNIIEILNLIDLKEGRIEMVKYLELKVGDVFTFTEITRRHERYKVISFNDTLGLVGTIVALHTGATYDFHNIQKTFEEENFMIVNKTVKSNKPAWF